MHALRVLNSATFSNGLIKTVLGIDPSVNCYAKHSLAEWSLPCREREIWLEKLTKK